MVQSDFQDEVLRSTAPLGHSLGEARRHVATWWGSRGGPGSRPVSEPRPPAHGGTALGGGPRARRPSPLVSALQGTQARTAQLSCSPRLPCTQTCPRGRRVMVGAAEFEEFVTWREVTERLQTPIPVLTPSGGSLDTHLRSAWSLPPSPSRCASQARPNTPGSHRCRAPGPPFLRDALASNQDLHVLSHRVLEGRMLADL